MARCTGCLPAPRGLLRAAVIERRNQLTAEPATEPGAPGRAQLFTGPTPGTAQGRRSLQQALDTAAAYAGVTLAPPSFPDVEVHDLRRAS